MPGKKVLCTTVAVFAALQLSIAGPARAATLVAGPVLIDDLPSANDYLRCALVNAGTKPIRAEITVHLLGQTLPATVEIAPGETYHANELLTGGARDGWCSFAVSGSARHVRATACAVSAIGSDHVCTAIVPAR